MHLCKRHGALLSGILFLLSACGGGGGDSSPVPGDLVPPQVLSIAPASAQLNAPIDLTWNEAVNCNTVTTTSVTISPAVPLSRTSCNGAGARFTPLRQLTGTTYTVSVSTAVTDLAGNAMAAPFALGYDTPATPAVPAVQSYPAAADIFEGTTGDNTIATAAGMSVDAAPQVRTLYPAGDVDWVSVELVGGVSYEISANFLNAVGDSYLDLFSATGPTEVTAASHGTADFTFRDDNLALDSEILFTPAASGRYLVRVLTTTQAPGSIDLGPVGELSYLLSVHTYVDGDNDGFSSYYDCNDGDNGIFPGAAEIAGDGIDQDCSGTDELTATTPDSHEVDLFASPAPLTERTMGEEVIFQSAIYTANGRTLHNAGDNDYFSLTVPAFGLAILELPINGVNPATMVAEVFNALQAETDPPAIAAQFPQGIQIVNGNPTAQTYTVRFSGADASGGYYVPTFSSLGSDADGDTFYSRDGDFFRDCDDSNAAINPFANDPAGDGIDSNCDGVDGFYDGSLTYQ